ncbi:Rid family hydrolase [Actinomadura verrucosospora]|uniref:Endoribonuclease L-PSP n=1 Tax=Actinomadura verrucosospora TaxID=46165 RepID=A0A7D3ZJ58_ACTVE|nr:Rid family hydrolase [Actinomadura verrucosospora]QKG25417.1 endoribonuclease L-PSP [Actinomadura verrucosospora]
MNRVDIDPRMFGDRLGYERAVLIERPERWLFVAGHEARGEDGAIAHAGDIRAQVALSFRRLRETLGKAGFALADVVQIRLFTVDLPALTANYDAVTAELAAGDCRPASLLAGVDALSDPAMLLEIEAVAAQ